MIFSRVRHFLFLLFVASIVLGLFFYSAFGREFDVSDVRNYADWLGPLLPITFIVFYATLSIFIPTTPMMALSGILFGFWYGLLYTVLAGFISSFTTFYISRFLGKDFVDKILHRKFLAKLEKYDQKIAKNGFWTVTVLRMIPVMPFNVLNLLMGISRVSTRSYILGTLLGLAPSNVLAIYFGPIIFEFVSNKIVALLLGTSFLVFLLFFAHQNHLRKQERV